MNNVAFAWNEDTNGWVSETICLTGDIHLIVSLEERGTLVIKKGETEDGPFPKVLVTKHVSTDYKIRIHGSTEQKYIKIITSTEPNNIQYANI